MTPSYPWDDAAALIAACEDTGMEGVMLKRRDSPYVPGKRTDAWRKVKCPSWREQPGDGSLGDGKRPLTQGRAEGVCIHGSEPRHERAGRP